MKFQFLVTLITILGVRSVALDPPKAREQYPYYVSVAVPSLHDKLYRQVISEIMQNGLFFNERNSNLAPFPRQISPRDLKEIFNFSLPSKSSKGEDANSLLNYVKLILQFSQPSSHPLNLHRNSVGLDPYAVVGDWLGIAMSASLLTYQIAPVFTLMELEVGLKLRQLIGYDLNNQGDVMTVPGRTAGNGYAIQMALQFKFPGIKEKGFLKQNILQPVLFVSKHGADAVNDLCAWQGIGTDFCVRVEVNEFGRMDVEDLERKINLSRAAKMMPFLVIATAGTPILGAIDPIRRIGEVARKYKMWLHIDSFVSNAFLSTNQKHRMDGIEMSDSFLWNVDKSMGAPFLTSILVTSDQRRIVHTFSFKGPYTSFANQLYNATHWDRGGGTLQCTRRPDVIKAWFLIKSKGTRGLERHVDYVYSLTSLVVEKLTRRNFQLVQKQFDSHHVAFYYVPKLLRKLSLIERETILKSSKYTETLAKVLKSHGLLLVSVDKLEEHGCPFMVLNLGNSALKSENFDFILNEIEHVGESQLLRRQLELSKMIEDFQEVNQFDKNLPRNVAPNLNASSKFPPFVSSPIKSLHEKFLNKFWTVILENGTYFEDRSQGHLFKTPEELLQLFDFSLNQADPMTEMAASDEFESYILFIVQNVIKYSAHFGHPFWNHHHLIGIDPYSAMADFVVSSINQPDNSYEVNPIFALMEQEILRAVRVQIGYSEHGGDGIILPGGSAAIQLAMLLARMVKQPEDNFHGILKGGRQLVAFISAGGHFATGKGSLYMGLGLENVVQVDVDQYGGMDPIALCQAVKSAVDEGKLPFLVVATSGTTVFGAFDPLDKMADICQEFKMWLHVDGTYGGVNIFALNQTRKNILLNGLERADSFNFNPQKVLSVARENSIFITKSYQGKSLRGLPPGVEISSFCTLINSNPFEKYHRSQKCQLNENTNNFYAGEDEFSLKTRNRWWPERRETSFKIWFQWKAKGLLGLGEHVEYIYKIAREVTNEIRNQSPAFLLPFADYEPMSPHVNFYYVPKRLRSMNPHSEEFWREMIGIQNKITAILTRQKGIVLTTWSSNAPAVDHEGRRTYLVMGMQNSAFNLNDAKFILNLIDYYGKNL